MVRAGSVVVCVMVAGVLAAQEPWRAGYDEARRLGSAGKMREAIAVLDRCVQEHERAAPLYCLRARCRAEARDTDGAMADANRAIELDPKLADAWVERGYLRVSKGDLAGAIADYDEAIRIEPKNAMAFGDRGDARMRLGDLLGARTDYDAALRIRPDFGAALHNRALVNMSLGAWKAAARDQSRAIPLLPPMWRMWSILAQTQESLGRWRSVLTSVEKGLAYEGADVGMLLEQRAHAQWRLGEHAAAIEARQNAFVAANTPAKTALHRQHLGCLQLAVGQNEAACDSFAACMADAEMRPWATAMTWCVGADNVTADRELRDAIAAWPADTPAWHHELAQACLTPADLPVPADFTRIPRTCVHAFLRGWRARRDGKADEARRWFMVCIDTGLTESAQWQVAYAALGLRADAPATLGCTLRAVPEAEPPRLEVAELVVDGPAALRGLRVGDRIAMVNDQAATMDAFADATSALVIGTPVRFALERDDKRSELWVSAGVGAR